MKVRGNVTVKPIAAPRGWENLEEEMSIPEIRKVMERLRTQVWVPGDDGVIGKTSISLPGTRRWRAYFKRDELARFVREALRDARKPLAAGGVAAGLIAA
jgi:hypothetical protein